MKDLSLGKLVLIAFGLFFVLGGGAIFIHNLITALDDKADEVSKLHAELKDLENKEIFLQKKRAEYARWLAISLPPELSVAEKRYHSLLVYLVQKNRLDLKTIGKGGALQSGIGRSPNLTALSFKLSFEGNFARVIGFLRDFYLLNLPHQIRSCSITPQSLGADGKLLVTLNIEAAVLPGAQQRDFLPAMLDKRIWSLEVLSAMSGLPTGLATAPSLLAPTGIYGANKLADQNGQERDYNILVQKNPFAMLVSPESASAPDAAPTPPDRDVLKYVELIAITESGAATEALLHSKITNKFYKLRAQAGYDLFEIHDEGNRLVLKGKVVSITPRALTFQTEGKSYTLDVGQYVAEALKNRETLLNSKAETPKATSTHDDDEPDKDRGRDDS
jgi:Tfp pilus assembly protein PilZ